MGLKALNKKGFDKMNCKERLKDYLDGYSSQYNFKDENDIEHDLNSDIEEMLKQNQKLEQALDEIEKYIENHKRESELHIYGLTIPKFIFNGDIEDIEEIIQKAKGDVKNESKS